MSFVPLLGVLMRVLIYFTSTFMSSLTKHCQGRYSEADGVYVRAIGIMEKASGPDHQYHARTLSSRAGLLRKQVILCQCLGYVRS